MTIKEQYEELCKEKDQFRKEESREERNIIQKKIDDLEDKLLTVITVGKGYKLNEAQILVNMDDLLEIVELITNENISR